MVVNFRTREINRGIQKLVRILILIIIKKQSKSRFTFKIINSISINLGITRNLCGC
jgi:hypothetical protein